MQAVRATPLGHVPERGERGAENGGGAQKTRAARARTTRRARSTTRLDINPARQALAREEPRALQRNHERLSGSEEGAEMSDPWGFFDPPTKADFVLGAILFLVGTIFGAALF